MNYWYISNNNVNKHLTIQHNNSLEIFKFKLSIVKQIKDKTYVYILRQPSTEIDQDLLSHLLKIIITWTYFSNFILNYIQLSKIYEIVPICGSFSNDNTQALYNLEDSNSSDPQVSTL